MLQKSELTVDGCGCDLNRALGFESLCSFRCDTAKAALSEMFREGLSDVTLSAAPTLVNRNFGQILTRKILKAR